MGWQTLVGYILNVLDLKGRFIFSVLFPESCQAIFLLLQETIYFFDQGHQLFRILLFCSPLA